MIAIATEAEKELVEKILGNDFSKYGEIIITGVGGANACEQLRNIDINTPIINIGYVGSSNTAIGTIVEVNECRIYHPNVRYKEPIYKFNKFILGKDTPKMLCLTSNDFVLESNQRDCVFDMELAHICALGFKNLYSIKVVSDNLSLHQYDKTTGDTNVRQN